VLLFPTAGGDAEEVERWQMIDVLAPLIDSRHDQGLLVRLVAGKALVTGEGTPRHRMWLQNQFHQYMRHEVVPAIRTDCKDPPTSRSGRPAPRSARSTPWPRCAASPTCSPAAWPMSGTYDLRRFYDARPDEFTDQFWASSPLHFVPTLGGRHLDVLRTRYILMPVGEGKAEDIGESWNLAKVLGRAGVPNRVDSWGPDWPHDWITWRKMLPQTLEQSLREGVR
jgi:esterase/lipase superfamily enzyme